MFTLKRRERFPIVNELVIGTVKEIYDHGAFVTLDEYGGIEAYVPLNEVSHSWFRGIREVIKVGQKRVFKVIRVNRAKRLIDVSLKRVSEAERKEKMMQWKRAQRAEKILELAAKKLRKTLNDAYREAGWIIEDYYGEIYKGLEEAHLRGADALVEAGVPKRWAVILSEIAKSSIKVPKAKISGIFTVRCIHPDGVKRLKRVLTSWEKNTNIPENVVIKFYVAGSPRYKIDIEALDYKTAEGILKQIINNIMREAKKQECEASFERLKG